MCFVTSATPCRLKQGPNTKSAPRQSCFYRATRKEPDYTGIHPSNYLSGCRSHDGGYTVPQNPLGLVSSTKSFCAPKIRLILSKDANDLCINNAHFAIARGISESKRREILKASTHRLSLVIPILSSSSSHPNPLVVQHIAI
jgi:hypothetical protein